ncbi:PPE domain-containing protein [Saccharopolyspora sp. ID03-671]|uniref:WXG100 family type VII secretion target n=1 Tax=Saccharopolyspora sp. ID03-671 TaxID=3073066 RepID=UPI003250F48A
MPEQSPDLALVETQNWASRSHEELYDAVHIDNDPGRAGQLADEWTKLGREMAEAADRMSEKLRATEAGWQGEAADAARSAIQKLADWSRDAGESAGALAERMSEQGRIMEKAKAEMPEPVKTDDRKLGLTVATAYAAGDLESFVKAQDDIRVAEERSSNAHEQAVRVMTRMESSSREIDGDTPRFERPPDPIEDLKKKPSPGSGDDVSAKNSEQGPAGTRQQFADGGSQATQKISKSSLPPSGQQAPPLSSQTGGTGPEGAPLSAQQGPTPPGANAPTKKMQLPGITSQSSADAPTMKANPVNPASSGPQQNPPQLGDHKSNHTTPQGSSWQGGDSAQAKTRKMRPVQGPGDGYQGPGGRRPNGRNDRGGNRNWEGKLPPIPETGGPGSEFPGNAQTNLASGGSAGGGGGSVPQMPAAGGAAGSNLTPGGSVGVGGGQGADHGAPAQGPSGGSAAGQSGGMTGGGAMGAGAMGGAMGRGGQGNQDEERKVKYVEGGPVVEVPGKDLPPPVIGEGKKKKKSEE